ncbi:hypothetical protein [Streptomyces violaceusniger]|uniref:hypothetical protein n=1 Tax=Streptomyces violaceusniger TaxID=68280 RepID=UPI00381B09ED
MPPAVTILSVIVAVFLALFASLGAYLLATWLGEDRRRRVVWAACTFPVALGTVFLIYDQLRVGQGHDAARSLGTFLTPLT